MKSISIATAILLSCIPLAAGREISLNRAQELADRYFVYSFPEIGGGSALRPVKRFDYWAFVLVIGYGGIPSGTIRVNRTTGDVSYDGPLGRRSTVPAANLDQWAARQKVTRKP
jgi:hypothetical protein